MKRGFMLKIMKLISQVGILYVFSLIGNWIVEVLKIPIPGSIVGLLLLFCCLHLNILKESYIKDGAGFMLVVLPLFLVPSTVGVIQYPSLLSWNGLLLIVLVMGSTFLTMILAGWMTQWYEMKSRKGER